MRKVLLFVLLAGGLVLAPSSPAAAHPFEPGDAVVGVVGAGDRQLWVGHAPSDLAEGLTEFQPLGGRLKAAPAVAMVVPDEVEAPPVPVYVATGTDDQLWVRRHDTPWRLLSHARTHCIGSPAAVVYDRGPTQLLKVGCRGSDNQLWFSEDVITESTIPFLDAWDNAGGVLTEGPAVADLDGVIQFLVIGVGGKAYFTTGDSGFGATSWTCKGHPGLSTGEAGTWFGCHGTDDALWTSELTGGQWAQPVRFEGRLVDGVGVAVDDLTARFFVQGTDGQLWEATIEHAAAARTPFRPMGGRIVFGAGATVAV